MGKLSPLAVSTVTAVPTIIMEGSGLTGIMAASITPSFKIPSPFMPSARRAGFSFFARSMTSSGSSGGNSCIAIVNLLLSETRKSAKRRFPRSRTPRAAFLPENLRFLLTAFIISTYFPKEKQRNFVLPQKIIHYHKEICANAQALLLTLVHNRYYTIHEAKRKARLFGGFCMDTVSLIYFSEAAKDLNFTKTAQRLFISQQTLSNHIARLEEAYQVKLFERKPRLMLTSAGETLLSFARDYKTSEENLKAQLTDISQRESAQLRIGCTPHRTSIVMPILAEEFAQRYPNVELDFYVYHSTDLVEMLVNGELDIALAIEKVGHPLIQSTPLFRDQIYIMVSQNLLNRYYGDRAADLVRKTQKNGADLKDFLALPFVDIRSASLIRDVFSSCDLKPNFGITINYPQFALPGFFENAAASIITTTTYAHIRNQVPENILFFRVNTTSRLSLHDIAFMHLEKKHLSRYEKYFFQLAKSHFEALK